jgi:hypothetical protein
VTIADSFPAGGERVWLETTTVCAEHRITASETGRVAALEEKEIFANQKICLPETHYFGKMDTL